MKNNIKLSKIRSLESSERNVSMVSLSDSKGLKAFLVKYGWRIIRLSTNPKGPVTNRMKMIMNFGDMLIKMNKHHGPTYTVKWLKASQLAIQRSIAGRPVRSLRDIEPDLPLPRVSRKGIPVMIRSEDRRALSRGHPYTTIRLYLSIFGLYRVLKAPYKLKLNTITDPFSGNLRFVRQFQDWLKINSIDFAKCIRNSDIRAKGLLPIEKSSPSNNTSWHGQLTDAYLLARSDLQLAFISYCEATDNTKLLKSWRACWGVFSWNKELLARLPLKRSVQDISGLKGSCLGQLSLKEEAAGKLRVFAMVDIWTQSLLKPLHKAIFTWLRSLTNDGTFDQDKAFKRAVAKAKVAGYCAAFDLSAATDRLPLMVQMTIMERAIGSQATTAWSALMTGRDYYLLPDQDGHVIEPQAIRYAVGQPMGAYSSWGMLAVTHHYIVQYCAARVGLRPDDQTWFDGYEVLGDDIVIFNKEVAEEYLKACEGLGVSINMSKSVISDNGHVVEFAKRTSLRGVDVSAISWRMLAANDHLLGRVQISMHMLLKGVGRSALAVIQDASRRNPWSLTKVDIRLGLLGVLLALGSKGNLPWSWVIKLMTDPINGCNQLITFRGLLPEFNFGKAVNAVNLWWRGGDVRTLRFKSTEDFARHNQMMEIESHETFLNAREVNQVISKMSWPDYTHRRNAAYQSCILRLSDELEIALYEDAKRTAMVEHPEVVDKYKGKVPGYLANRYYQMFRTEYIMLNQHDVCDHRPLGSLRFKKTPCVAVKSIAWNRIDDVWHYHVFDKHTGPLAEWSEERIQTDPRNGELLEVMRSYDAELSIALREAERSTVIPNEFKRLVRLAEAGALLRDKRNREREGGSYFM